MFCFVFKPNRKDRKDEANELIEKLDTNKTGRIDFSSYANETFGSGILELLSLPNTHFEHLDELKVLYELERNKWLNFSTGESLDYANFYEFLFADESPRLGALEKEISFRSYDTNGDGYLSFEEFSVAIKGTPKFLILLSTVFI